MPDHTHTTVPRSIRLAEEVQRILAEIFLSRVQIQNAGIMTITHVELNRDLRIAKIYLSFLNPSIHSTQILKGLLRRRKEIRYRLGAELKARYVPELRFYLDDTVERSARIDAILQDIHHQRSAANG